MTWPSPTRRPGMTCPVPLGNYGHSGAPEANATAWLAPRDTQTNETVLRTRCGVVMSGP
jgi:hypothetical protein